MTPEDVELQRHYADVRKFCFDRAVAFAASHTLWEDPGAGLPAPVRSEFQLKALLGAASQIELFVTGAYPHARSPDHVDGPTQLERMRLSAEAQREREENRT